ncbi:MAG TPA: carbonic anhydrase family protein [Burkholderiaceae bacterium]|nr:carbonic anhydrase family protein [Burkholderiaceae bacterium]
MNKKGALLVGLLFYGGFAHADAGSWGYTGATGPTHWGTLDPSFSVCDAGRSQSPINIQAPLTVGLPPLQLDYAGQGKTIVNNGHTVQVDFDAKSGLMLDGTRFELKQVHFHAPSENQVNGKSYPFEAHLVHADASGNLAVIGVMFEHGAPNAGLQKLWADMPKDKNAATELKSAFAPADILPAARDYFRFSGSLTTPPCSEGVRWLVLKSPMTVAPDQVAQFEKLMGQPTNRPVQPLHARLVVQ